MSKRSKTDASDKLNGARDSHLSWLGPDKLGISEAILVNNIATTLGQTKEQIRNAIIGVLELGFNPSTVILSINGQVVKITKGNGNAINVEAIPLYTPQP